MKTIVYAGNLGTGRGAEFEIHGAGCGHVAKIRRTNQFAHLSNHEVDGTVGVAEFVVSEAATYQSQDQGWSVRDFRVLPCARGGLSAGEFAKLVEVAAHEATADDDDLTFGEVMTGG